MKICSPALAHKPNLTACCAAVFCLIASREHLHLLRGVHAGNTDDRAATTSADRRGTVKRDQRILRAGSVDLERDSATDRKVEVPKRGTAAKTGKQRSHVERIASVQLLIADLLSRNLALHCSRLRLQHRRGCGHFYSFGQLTDFERRIDIDRRARAESVMCS